MGKRIKFILGLIILNILVAIIFLVKVYQNLPSFAYYPAVQLIIFIVIFSELLIKKYWGWLLAIITFGFALFNSIVDLLIVERSPHLIGRGVPLTLVVIAIHSLTVILLLLEKDSFDENI